MALKAQESTCAGEEGTPAPLPSSDYIQGENKLSSSLDRRLQVASAPAQSMYAYTKQTHTKPRQNCLALSDMLLICTKCSFFFRRSCCSLPAVLEARESVPPAAKRGQPQSVGHQPSSVQCGERVQVVAEEPSRASGLREKNTRKMENKLVCGQESRG